jgi:hypothetical protein
MTTTPRTVFLDKPHLKGIVEAVRTSKGQLIVLAGAVRKLQLSWFIMEDVKIQLRADGVQFIDMARVGTQPIKVGPDCSGKIVVFDELRLQEGHEYSTDIATQYLAAGATVLAVVDGADESTITTRLFMLGMPKKVIQDKLKLMDSLQEIA